MGLRLRISGIHTCLLDFLDLLFLGIKQKLLLPSKKPLNIIWLPYLRMQTCVPYMHTELPSAHVIYSWQEGSEKKIFNYCIILLKKKQ